MLDIKDIRMLVDIGFIALSRGLNDHAEAIFTGVQAAAPDQEAGHIGLALTHLHRGETDSAVAILRKLPPSDAARAFLGIALARSGAIADARHALRNVVDTAPGTSFATMADAALAEYADAVARSPAPARRRANGADHN